MLSPSRPHSVFRRFCREVLTARQLPLHSQRDGSSMAAGNRWHYRSDLSHRCHLPHPRSRCDGPRWDAEVADMEAQAMGVAYWLARPRLVNRRSLVHHQRHEKPIWKAAA